MEGGFDGAAQMGLTTLQAQGQRGKSFCRDLWIVYTDRDWVVALCPCAYYTFYLRRRDLAGVSISRPIIMYLLLLFCLCIIRFLVVAYVPLTWLDAEYSFFTPTFSCKPFILNPEKVYLE
jgi:hypothetical protein